MLKYDYILLNNTISLQAVEQWEQQEADLIDSKKIYVIQDQVIPPNSEESSAAQQKLAAFAKQQQTNYFYGSTMASHYLTNEIVRAGDIVAANDADIFMVGAKGALGLVLSAAEMTEALKNGSMAVSGLEKGAEGFAFTKESKVLEVEVIGALASDLDMRSAGIALMELAKDKIDKDTIVVFLDKTGWLALEARMLLCGWCQRLGVQGALFLTKPVAEEAVAAAITLDLDKVQRGYAKPQELALGGQEVVAVYIGGSHGGFLEDIKLVAELVKGKQLAPKVRLSIAPASSEVYYLAATAGYLTTIMQAGGLILNQCALPPVQARIGAGEILVSNDIHNEENYAGKDGLVVLTDTRTAVAIALAGGFEGYCPGNKNVATTREVNRCATVEETNLPKSFTGRVWKFGDDIDTDIIMPTQHLSYATMEEIKTHVFEPLRPELASLIQEGDIIVAGKNFGCGSSREQAAEILAFAGIKAIVAKSFARIFFRNAINNGVLLIECPDLPDKVVEGDILTVNINDCIEHKGLAYPIPYLADNLYRLVMAGGLVKSTQKQNGLL